MLRALESIAGWPVGHAAAAVLAPDAELHGWGDLDRPFALASVTKLLTALAVLVAAEEGSVSLDEPVGAAQGATVRDVLAHASGLGPEDGDPVAPPRQRRIYSNRGYAVLAELVAERTSMPFGDYLELGVLEPLGMGATALEGSAANGARSTVADLARLAGDLRGSRLVSSGTLADMAMPHLPELDGVLPGYGLRSPNPWGLGPEVRGHKHPHWTGASNSPATFGHFGQAGTLLWFDPEAAVTLVVLTDRDFGAWAARAWPTLADAVLDEVAAS